MVGLGGLGDPGVALCFPAIAAACPAIIVSTIDYQLVRRKREREKRLDNAVGLGRRESRAGAVFNSDTSSTIAYDIISDLNLLKMKP